MMRILHTEWMRAKGGQALRILEDLAIAQELGHTAYLAAHPQSWLFEEARARGFQMVAIPFGHLANPIPYLALMRTIISYQIDIVQTHSAKDSYPATYAAKLLGKKVVRSRHTDLRHPPGHLYRWADRIVTTGDLIKKELIAYGIAADKIVSIPTYPDPHRFTKNPTLRQQMRQAYGIKEGEGLLIGTLAGSYLRKRAQWLIRALEHLPSTVTLLIGGGGTQESDRLLRSQIANTQQRVRYVGYVQPEHFLQALDIYVCPSSQEGLPQSLMQAMMMGLPVLSTDVGSIRELNIDNNLLLCKKDDFHHFLHQLKTVVHHATLRQALGEKNGILARHYFHRGLMVSRTQALYDSLKESYGL